MSTRTATLPRRLKARRARDPLTDEHGRSTSSARWRWAVRGLSPDPSVVPGEFVVIAGHPTPRRNALVRRLAEQALTHANERLIVLDEPQAGLDRDERTRQQLALHRLWCATGATVLLATADADAAAFLASRVLGTASGSGHLVFDERPTYAAAPRGDALRLSPELADFVARIRRATGI